MSLCWRRTPRLVGIVEIRDLLALPDTSAVTGIARDPAPYRVSLEDDRGAAASQATRAGLSILAVCDAEGRLLGAVPARSLMSILRDEHIEDLHHMAGILNKSEAARDALTAPPHRRAL
jgi:magnesium transporter